MKKSTDETAFGFKLELFLNVEGRILKSNIESTIQGTNQAYTVIGILESIQFQLNKQVASENEAKQMKEIYYG